MKWTEAELQLLRTIYGTMSVQAVATALGRTRMAVAKKASDLKMDGKPDRWPEHDKQILGLLYPTTPVPELALLLGRSEKNVRAMAHAMGLFRTKTAKSEVAYRRLPLGSERPNQHGQMMRKVKESGPYRQAWKRVDVLTWEAANGPVPKGKVVTLLDHSMPPALENLTLATRAEMAQRNSPQSNYPPEVAALFPLKAAITRQVNRLQREQMPVE